MFNVVESYNLSNSSPTGIVNDGLMIFRALYDALYFLDPSMPSPNRQQNPFITDRRIINDEERVRNAWYSTKNLTNDMVSTFAVALGKMSTWSDVRFDMATQKALKEYGGDHYFFQGEKHPVCPIEWDDITLICYVAFLHMLPMFKEGKLPVRAVSVLDIVPDDLSSDKNYAYVHSSTALHGQVFDFQKKSEMMYSVEPHYIRYSWFGWQVPFFLVHRGENHKFYLHHDLRNGSDGLMKAHINVTQNLEHSFFECTEDIAKSVIRILNETIFTETDFMLSRATTFDRQQVSKNNTNLNIC